METVDLFSGCGGLSLSFQNAGFEILAAFDKWEAAVKVYRDNFNHPIYSTDLGSDEGLKFVKSLKPKMIIGGRLVKISQVLGKEMKLWDEQT